MHIPTLTALLLPFIAATPLTPKTFTASAPAKLILFGEHAVTVQNNVPSLPPLLFTALKKQYRQH